jgi:DnaJ homolog subfamily C member 8
MCAVDVCRQISLLIHPDRCKHPHASDAFEVLGAAQGELLNEESCGSLMRVLEYAREVVREERRKATKHDAGVRVAAQMHPDGRQGVEREWESTDEFHEKWKIKSRDVLAKSEFRRRKLSKR